MDSALQVIRDAGIPVLNVDLIYGIDGRTGESFVASIDCALRWRPEELRLYRAGRDLLRENGYVQNSMRMFRRADAPELGPDDYACQGDGMIGLGCGARSYNGMCTTRSTESSSPSPAVGVAGRGYVHLESLPLYDVFAGGVLERIPAGW